jgi:hypothetical protein
MFTLEGTEPKYTTKLGKQSGTKKVTNKVVMSEYWIKPDLVRAEFFADAMAAQGLRGKHKVGPDGPRMLLTYPKS